MVHYSEKDLINFATKKIDKDKISDIEKHLSECFQCSNEYDFLILKLNLDSYIEYRKLKAQKQPSICITSDILKDYAAGKILDKEKKKIEDHLICCEKCRTSFLNLDLTNSYSLWTSIKDMTSETLNWIKEVYFAPVLDPDFAVKSTPFKQLDNDVIVYPGDKIKIKIPVIKPGYMSVFIWDGKRVSLRYPDKKECNTFVKVESEELELTISEDASPGTHHIKIFITEEKLLNSEEIDFDNTNNIPQIMEKFIQKLDETEEDKWSQELKTYEIKEFNN